MTLIRSLITAVGATAVAPTAVKTSNYTAAANQLVPVDTTSGNVTVTLPTAPADGTLVAVKHVVRGGTNTVSLACGGSDVFNVAGGAASGTITLLNQGTVLQYKASTAIWYSTATDLSLSQLDLRYLAVASNLSDLGSAATARTNLGVSQKLTPTATKTSGYTAVAGDLVVCDTTSAGFTVTLPAATAGALIAVRKDDTTVNAVTIARNGADVFGAVNTVTSLTLDVPRQVITLVGVSGGWIPSSGIPTPRSLPDAQVFTTSGTWTKPAGATRVTVLLVGAGGGGGSGCQQPSGTATSGGAGGGGGGYAYNVFRATDLAATETVTIGAAGTGAAAIAGTGTNGGTGVSSGTTSFGTGQAKVRVTAATGGAGGSTATATAGFGGNGGNSGGNGGNSTAGAAGGAGSTVGGPSGSGGGSGGGIATTPTAFAGAASGSCAQTALSTGSAGAINTGGGSGSSVTANQPIGGTGGGGGGSSITTTGGAGGNGGTYGGGGGGGGSSLNGSSSGKGGDGGPGIAIVISD